MWALLPVSAPTECHHPHAARVVPTNLSHMLYALQQVSLSLDATAVMESVLHVYVTGHFSRGPPDLPLLSHAPIPHLITNVVFAPCPQMPDLNATFKSFSMPSVPAFKAPELLGAGEPAMPAPGALEQPCEIRK